MVPIPFVKDFSSLFSWQISNSNNVIPSRNPNYVESKVDFIY